VLVVGAVVVGAVVVGDEVGVPGDTPWLLESRTTGVEEVPPWVRSIAVPNRHAAAALTMMIRPRVDRRVNSGSR
jgi:hypothetical protein